MRVGLALPHYDFSLASGGPISFEAVATEAVRAERLGFDSVWVSDHFFVSLGRLGGGPDRYGSLEPMADARGARPDDVPGPARDARPVGGLPSPRPRREGRLGDRPALRRAARARPGSRVVRRRVRGVRLPVRLGGRAVRAARGDRRVPRGAVRRRAGVVPREAVRDARGVQPSEARPGAAAAAAGRQGRAEAAPARGTLRGRMEHGVAVDAGGLRPPRRGRPRSVRAFRTRSRAVPPVARPVHRGRPRRGRRDPPVRVDPGATPDAASRRRSTSCASTASWGRRTACSNGWNASRPSG